MFVGLRRFELVQAVIVNIITILVFRTVESLSQADGVQEFVSRLITKSFSNCSLLILQDKHDKSQNVNKLMSALEQNAYVIKFKNVDLIEGESNNATEKYPVQFSNIVSNTRKRSSFCSLAALFVNDVNSKFIYKIQQVISPTFIPIIRKDEDHFIFITKPEYHEHLLLMKELPGRIKFKIAVGKLDNGSNVITTIDLFGGELGSPLVMHFPSSNVPTENVDYFPDFAWNLNGKVLRVSIPYTYSKVEANLPWGSVKNGKRGSSKYLLEEFLMVKFNFTYTMIVSTGFNGQFGGGGTGLELPNGTWIGITGDLLYGRADLGLAIVSTDKRVQYIGFTDTYFDTGCLTFVTGRPSQIYSASALFWPFNVYVWISVCCAVIFSMAFFFIVFKLVARDLGDCWSITQQISVLLSPFVEQDSVLPKSSPLRFFFAFWSFFAMVVNTLYRSKLVTLLAFPVLIKVPETFEQLAYSDFKVAFMKHGDSALNTFKVSTDPVYLKLYKEMEVIKGVGLECLEKVVREENYACIAYDFDVSHLRGRNFSDAESRKIVTSSARTYNIWIGVATEANSIYRINFGKVLGNTMPFHMVNLWDQMDMYSNVKLLKLNWWAETNQTQNSKEDAQDSQNLTLKHMKGSFYMLFGSISLSFLVFFFEFAALRLRCVSTWVINARN